MFNVAKAGLVFTTTSTQYQTIDAQNFSFTFHIEDWEHYDSSSLSLVVLGDFDDVDDEYFTLSVEGIDIGQYNLSNSDNSLHIGWPSKWLLWNEVNFDTFKTRDWFADGTLTFNVILSSEVEVLEGGEINTDTLPYVQATFTAVPEPASLTILGLGLAGLAVRRFKKQS